VLVRRGGLAGNRRQLYLHDNEAQDTAHTAFTKISMWNGTAITSGWLTMPMTADEVIEYMSRLLHLLRSLPVQVFGRRRSRINPHAQAAGVGKAPRHEIADGVQWRRGVRYGDFGAGLGFRGWTAVAAAVGLRRSHDERIGVNERSARCPTGFAVPIRANPEDGCECGRGRRGASGDGVGW
jgi:hypothetical protein